MDQGRLDIDRKTWLLVAGYRWAALAFVAVAWVAGATSAVSFQLIALVFFFAVVYTLFLTLGSGFLPRLFSRHFGLNVIDFGICFTFFFLTGAPNSSFFFYTISPVLLVSVSRGFWYSLIIGVTSTAMNFLAMLYFKPLSSAITLTDLRTPFAYLIAVVIMPQLSIFQRQLKESNAELLDAKNGLAKNNQALASANRQLLTLQTISTALQSSLGLPKVVAAVINGFKYGLDFNRVIFALVDEDSDTLTSWVVVGAERAPEHSRKHQVFLTAGSPVMRFFDSGEPIDDSDPNYHATLEQVASCLYATPWLITPLCVGEKPIGIIIADDHANGRRSEADLSWLKLLATQAAVAINNAQLHAKMQESAVLSERNRIAMEIHDGLFQTLSGARLILDSCNRLIESQPEVVQPKLVYLDNMLGRSYEEMRYSISNLRLPFLASDNYAAFLHQTIDEFAAVSGIEIGMKLRDSENIERLSEDVKFCLYRVVQESFSNVRKHAQATTLAVFLGIQEDQVVLRIIDNGRGFSVEDALRQAESGRTFGIVALKSRVSQLGGELSIKSDINKGSQVLVSIPCSSLLDVNLDKSSRR